MHLHKTLSVISAVLAASALAAPVDTAPFRRSLAGVQFTKCDLSGAQLPTQPNAPVNLADPTYDTKLKKVLLGRGTQNYTCNPGSTDKPVAAGAIAVLYESSCLAAFHPVLFHELPGAFLQFPSKTEFLAADILQALADEDIIVGHHYFSNATTPVFDFRMNGKKDIFVGKKLQNIAAPPQAVKGKDNVGDGAVDWLKLAAIAGTVGFKEAYRVVTAGGKAPATCEKQKATFQVDYAAEYWFFN